MFQDSQPVTGPRKARTIPDVRGDEPRALPEERSFMAAVAPSAFDEYAVMSAIERTLAPSDVADKAGPEPRAFRSPLSCRALDLIIAITALLFVAPLLMALAALVYLHDGGPPIFSQPRIGLGGRKFRCLKFRSMVMDSDKRLADLLATNPAARAEWERDHKLRDDPRITPLGRFLRRSSLDELPQLFNVLNGDMSIVGPRPIVDAEIRRYGRHFRHYCAVRPGITGLWQVSGRNDVSYHRRVVMDVAYAKSKSLPVDLRIVLATVPAVLLRRGSY